MSVLGMQKILSQEKKDDFNLNKKFGKIISEINKSRDVEKANNLINEIKSYVLMAKMPPHNSYIIDSFDKGTFKVLMRSTENKRKTSKIRFISLWSHFMLTFISFDDK